MQPFQNLYGQLKATDPKLFEAFQVIEQELLKPAQSKLTSYAMTLTDISPAEDIAPNFIAPENINLQHIRVNLKQAIASDLKLKIVGTLNKNKFTIANLTIPSNFPVNAVLEFVNLNVNKIQDKTIISIDILDSDHSSDPTGVVSLTLSYSPFSD